MKIEDSDWLDWLHRYRAEREQERRRKGISDEDYMRQSFERGRRIMAELRNREQPAVARDRKPESDKPEPAD